MSRDIHTYTHRPRRPLDRVVAAALILTWLLMASVDTYAPLAICLCLWVGQALGMHWLWRQYLDHRAPSMLERPQPTTKAVIPMAVRLMLLPGAYHLVGPYNVRKARAIRFMRRDKAERARLKAERDQRELFSRATGTIPTDHRCSRHGASGVGTVHLPEPADPYDQGAAHARSMMGLADTYGLREHRHHGIDLACPLCQHEAGR